MDRRRDDGMEKRVSGQIKLRGRPRSGRDETGRREERECSLRWCEKNTRGWWNQEVASGFWARREDGGWSEKVE